MVAKWRKDYRHFEKICFFERNFLYLESMAKAKCEKWIRRIWQTYCHIKLLSPVRLFGLLWFSTNAKNPVSHISVLLPQGCWTQLVDRAEWSNQWMQMTWLSLLRCESLNGFVMNQIHNSIHPEWLVITKSYLSTHIVQYILLPLWKVRASLSLYCKLTTSNKEQCCKNHRG